MPKGQMHMYTDEQKKFLLDNVMDCSYHELTAAFNKKFDLNFSRDRISSALGRMGLRNGRDTHFQKGQIPFNKGNKGVRMSPATEFKKGQIPVNYRPIGSERIGKSRSNLGYTEVKVADPNKWRMKHVIVWEAEHGAVPKGHCVIFADSDKTNFSIDNLLLVTRAELARMNQKGYIFTNAELTKSGHIMAKLETVIGQRKRKGK